jgi:hypothetical protein
MLFMIGPFLGWADARKRGRRLGSADGAKPVNRREERLRPQSDAGRAHRGYRESMSAPRPAPADAGTAALLAVLALAEVFTRGDVAARDVLVALLATAPAAWRAVAPRLALGLCVLALLILSASRTDEFTVAQLLALMLVTYTVALL